MFFLPQVTLASLIDHTLLLPSATTADFERHFEEATEHSFFAVCIPPFFVSQAAKALKKSSVKICTVVGFANGYNLVATKVFETKHAFIQGAHEIDMVINIAALKSGDHAAVLDDIRSVVRAASGHTVKVILETCYLTREEKIAACELSMKAGAHFVKTSTGFGKGGATAEDVALMAQIVGGKLGVKASGGIHDRAMAEKLVSLGATRIGTSHGVSIVTGQSLTSTSQY